MNPSTMSSDLVALIPVISKQDKRNMELYFLAYEKNIAKYNVMFQRDLENHPVFGPLLKSIPKEVSEENSRISREMQRNAIFNGNWEQYVEYYIAQGMLYAKMGLDFRAWYEVVSLVRHYVIPDLISEYGSGNKFLDALNGMNTFFDIGMGIIGEAYLRQKNELIRDANSRLEEKVEMRTRQLESVNKELEAFTYSVSHDLRAPLRAINGYAEMLNEDLGPKLGEEGERITQLIKHYATKMGNLIDELLAFSQLGRTEMVKNKINMNELFDAVIQELKHSLKHKATIIKKELHAVTGDHTLLHQVVYNLLSNAVKYSALKEKPVVEISSYENKGELIFCVKDNGVGFDMKYADKLFNVFQRLHSEEEFEGTGVGLAIVQRIIMRHNGRVWAESKLNEGATFYFSLNNE